jgi:uridine kinase
LTPAHEFTTALQLAKRLLDLSQAASRPVVAAIDGRSGAGKSTLAAELARRVDATIVPNDDFFIGGVVVRDDDPETLFGACNDWVAARGVLRDLLEFGEARYHGFDWKTFDGSLREDETVLRTRRAIIFEGVYSARPELRDLVDVPILVELPEKERLTRLLAREGAISDWEAQWHRAEDWYFSNVVCRADFQYRARNVQQVEEEAAGIQPGHNQFLRAASGFLHAASEQLDEPTDSNGSREGQIVTRLPSAENAEVPRSKLVAYLLNPEHPDGWGKAVFFARFGFSRGAWDVLAAALRDHALRNEVASVTETSLGARYVVEGPLVAPGGRSPIVRSVWFQEGGLPPRLVTAYPLQQKQDDSS